MQIAMANAKRTRHAPDIMHMGTTKFGKKLLAVKNKVFRGFTFKFEGGGEIPDCLKGTFLGFKAVQAASAAYLKSQESLITADLAAKREAAAAV